MESMLIQLLFSCQRLALVIKGKKKKKHALSINEIQVCKKGI